MKRRLRSGPEWWMGKARTREVGRSLRLVPYWDGWVKREDGRLNVVIDPGPSFGAGDHPSTIMALELLEDAFSSRPHTPRPSVLDVGTGTGVLAVAALLLGAGAASAFDVDSASVVTARRNLQLNRDSIVRVNPSGKCDPFVGTVDAVKGEFDLVLANLAAPVLLRIQQGLTRLVRRTLILSGIADAMFGKTQEMFSKGLEITATRSVEGWNALRLELHR